MKVQAPTSGELPTESRVADLLLDIGSALLISGAHCGRVSRNIERVAVKFGYRVELFMTFTGLSVALGRIETPGQNLVRFRRCPLPGVHFGIVTGISLLTWRLLEADLTIAEMERGMAEIKRLPHHPRWMTLLGIGLACGCLCLLAGGDSLNAAIAFAASATGMVFRQEVLRMKFNPMIAYIIAALVTTLVAGTDIIWQLGVSPEKALATSVLYLVPGVPLINCVIDLIEGYVPTAIARGVFAGFILLCIAVGMSLGIMILGIANF